MNNSTKISLVILGLAAGLSLTLGNNAKALLYSELLESQGQVLGDQTSVGPYYTGDLVSDHGTVYFVSGSSKIAFTSWQVFIGSGYSPKNIIKGDLSNYSLSSYIMDSVGKAHPWGSWLINKGTVYYSTKDGLVGAPNAQVFSSNGGNWSKVVRANQADLATLNTNSPAPLLSANDDRVYPHGVSQLAYNPDNTQNNNQVKTNPVPKTQNPSGQNRPDADSQTSPTAQQEDPKREQAEYLSMKRQMDKLKSNLAARPAPRPATAQTSSACSQLTDQINNSSQWTQLGPNDGAVNSAYQATDGTLYIGTRTGGVYRSTDTGNTWQYFSNGLPPDIYIVGLKFLNNKLYLLSFPGPFVLNQNTWVPINISLNGSTYYVYDMDFSPSTGYWATTINNIFTSTDGINWTVSSSLPDDYFDYIHISSFDGSIYLQSGAGGIYQSKDKGVTWKKIYDQANSRLVEDELGNLYITQYDWNSGTISVYKKPVGQDSFSQTTSFSTQYYIINGTIAYFRKTLFVEDAADLYYSTDQGATFTRLPSQNYGVEYPGERAFWDIRQMLPDNTDSNSVILANDNGMAKVNLQTQAITRYGPIAGYSQINDFDVAKDGFIVASYWDHDGTESADCNYSLKPIVSLWEGDTEAFEPNQGNFYLVSQSQGYINYVWAIDRNENGLWSKALGYQSPGNQSNSCSNCSAVDKTKTPARYYFGYYDFSAGKSYIDSFDMVANGDNVNQKSYSLPIIYPTALVTDPSTPDRLVVVGEGGLYESLNQGKTWKKLLAIEHFISDMKVNPNNKNEIVLPSLGTVYFLRSGKLSSVDLPMDATDLNSTWIDSVAYDDSVPNVIYIGSRQGLFISLDDGATWKTFNQGLHNLGVHKILPKGDKVYLGTSGSGLAVINKKALGVNLPGPVISSFSGAPSSVAVGQSAILSWQVSGANSLSIDQGVGDVFGRTSVLVSPSQTTTYTLTAKNSAGTVTKTFTLTVTGGSAAGLSFSPTSLSFSSSPGGSNPPPQYVTLQASGTPVALNVSADQPWLSALFSGASGSVLQSTHTLYVTATTGSLAAGSYSGHISVSGQFTGSPIVISVNFTITSSPSWMNFSTPQSADSGAVVNVGIGSQNVGLLKLSISCPAGITATNGSGDDCTSPHQFSISQTASTNTSLFLKFINSTASSQQVSFSLSGYTSTGSLIDTKISTTIINPPGPAPTGSPYDYTGCSNPQLVSSLDGIPDGNIDSCDLTFLLAVVSNIKSCPAGKTCDIDGSGGVPNTLDIIKLQNIINSGTGTLSASPSSLAFNYSLWNSGPPVWGLSNYQTVNISNPSSLPITFTARVTTGTYFRFYSPGILDPGGNYNQTSGTVPANGRTSFLVQTFYPADVPAAAQTDSVVVSYGNSQQLTLPLSLVVPSVLGAMSVGANAQVPHDGFTKFRIPVYLTLNSGNSVNGLTFSVQYSSTNGAPGVANSNFEVNSQFSPVLPSATIDSGALLNFISVSWPQTSFPTLSSSLGNMLLGYLTGSVPSYAVPGQSFSVHIIAEGVLNNNIIRLSSGTDGILTIQ